MLFGYRSCKYSGNMFSDRVYAMINIVIVVCSFAETYVFPFAIIKWMIVITKYGGLVTLFKDFHRTLTAAKPKSISKYYYSLQLTTCFDKKLENKRSVSYLNVVTVAQTDALLTQLSYCGQDDCKRIPPALVNMYGAKVQYLDLSYNNIETLKGLEQFHRLEELILDNNKLNDQLHFPCLSHLRTLSLNNNQIEDLEALMDKISERFPALIYLSLLSNKACPNQLSDVEKDDSDYQRYRYYVIYRIPTLRFLDSRRVSSQERIEALKRGEFTRVRRPITAAAASVSLVPAKSDNLRPLPVNLAALGKHKGAYGKCNYKYTGKHSEGNRFIVNSDL